MEISRQEKERKFWEGFSDKYDFFIKKADATYSSLFDDIKNELHQEQTVLDVATGTGIIATEIASKVKKVYGCDISPNMIDICKRKAAEKGISNVEFIVCDAYQLQYDTEMFDVVIVNNGLHVMTDPKKALFSINRVLKKGGLLIAPTYCHGNSLMSKLISMIMSIAGFKAYQKWSINSYLYFIEKNKFRIKYSSIKKDIIPLLYVVAIKN